MIYHGLNQAISGGNITDIWKLEFPSLIREIRERTGLTQEKLAAKLGVTFPTINRWENGKVTPSPLGLKQVEDYLLSLGERGDDLRKKFFGETS